MNKYNLPLLTNDKDKVKKFYGDQYEHTMMQLASKAISVTSILKEVYNIIPDIQKSLKPSDLIQKPLEWKISVIIDDSQLFEYELCPQCNPEPGEKIIARSGKDGFKIHNLDCKALQTVALDKLIKAYRSGEDAQLYHFDINLHLNTKYVNLITLLSTLQDLGIAIESVNIQRPNDHAYDIHIKFSHKNPSKIAYVIQYIQKNYGTNITIKKKIT